ncbi:hypothetical protein [aff. Roholtiella sp. LEGE 12411]|nr:hypothetical protein [aff. Roholtiella sp. LEGE 12411]
MLSFPSKRASSVEYHMNAIASYTYCGSIPSFGHGAWGIGDN